MTWDQFSAGLSNYRVNASPNTLMGMCQQFGMQVEPTLSHSFLVRFTSKCRDQ